MDKQKELGTASIVSLIIKYSVPAIIAMMVNSLYTTIDRMFIGRIPGVGALAMSGVGITMPITYVIMGLGMLVGVGTAASISIKLGQQKRDVAENLLGNAVTLTFIISAIVTVFGLGFSGKILNLLGASPETLIYAKQFINVLLFGTIFNITGFALNQSIRSDGNPKMAMISMLIGAILNIILDPIFIFMFGWGIKGAAFATVLSQAVSSVWIFYYFTKGKSNLKIKKKYMILKKKLVKSIFLIGMSPCAMQIAASLVQVVSNTALLKYGGDMAVASMAIISSISMIFLMPIFGLNQGAQPIVGYNFGAKKYKRVKQAVLYPIIAATVIVSIGGLLIQLFPDKAIAMFNDNAELMKVGAHGIRIYLSMLPIVGFQIISSNYFLATGKGNIAMILSLLRQVIFLIPLLLILPQYLGLTGVWLAGPISDLLSSIVTGGFLIKEMKVLHKQEVSLGEEVSLS